jgi:C-terminal processing protease CtpA/Prc
MKSFPGVAWIGVFLSLSAYGQLTAEQKALDFQTVASVFAKQYAPYEWKRDTLSFDLFALGPWMTRVRETKDDLAYLEVLGEYIASLDDAHSQYYVNSDFVAELPLYTDLYEGRVLIELIDRALLPASRFDFAVGDEIVLFDGRPVLEVVRELARLTAFANPRSTQRWAADYLVYRPQTLFPRAAEIGDSATLLVRRSDGSERTYRLDWRKNGKPVTKLGPLPNFRFSTTGKPVPEVKRGATGGSEGRKAWISLQRAVAKPVKNLTGYAQRTPVYRMPAGFQQRLGRNRSDFFTSGTYVLDGKRIGFIRIPTFQPVDFALLDVPLRQFQTEIAFFKANTDALVVDVTRNEGGYVCYAEWLLQYLIAKEFTSIAVEIRPTLSILQDWRQSLEFVQEFGAEWEVNLYGSLLKDLETAYSENRGRTGSVPLCGPLQVQPATSVLGRVVAYDKPILLLIDEFSVSAAELFSAVIQDSGAAKLFGYRTAGAGGSPSTLEAGFFSEGFASVTQMLAVRPSMISVPGYPATRYIENVGVHPDIPYDYQRRESLVNGGGAFSEAFFRAAAGLGGN